MRQILFNLLSNASKFTQHGPSTPLAVARRSTDWVHFRVTDTGIGMSAEQMEKLFQEFLAGGRLDHAEVRRHGPRPRDQPAVLPDDGRRDHGQERLGAGATFECQIPTRVVSAAD